MSFIFKSYRSIFGSLLFIFAMSIAGAHDRQISTFAQASPFSILDPGYGAEYSDTLGNRTVFGLNLVWTEPDLERTRSVELAAGARLLYSSEYNTQWYPTATVAWNFTDRTLKPRLGVGFQHVTPLEVGFFSEALWAPYENEYQIKLGLRFWISRFKSLDTRIRTADPVGAVYKQRRSPKAPSLKPVKEDNVLVPVRPTVPVAMAIPETNIEPNDNRVAVIPADWYLHLGSFRQRDSLKPLEETRALVNYQHQLNRWYDDKQSLYRLLLGPITQPEALKLKAQLATKNVDSFLYQPAPNVKPLLNQ